MEITAPRRSVALYGASFMILLPALMVLWAWATSKSVHLPVPQTPHVGIALAVSGFVLMVVSMSFLVMLGDGLPMNISPPRHLVLQGPYRYIAHPIYLGFIATTVGISLAAGSSSGLWLVTPVAALGCVALVQGYEKQDFQRRFGADSKTLLHLPRSTEGRPAFYDRLSVLLLVLVPWCVTYETVCWLGVPPDAVSTQLAWERTWPVCQWTEAIYFSTYPVVLLAPMIANRGTDLRRFAVAGLFATVVITFTFLVLPLVAPPRPFTPHGWLGELLRWEAEKDSPAAAFPSFHVVWAFLAARVYARRWPRWRMASWSWAAAVSASALATGMHTILDVFAGGMAALAANRVDAIWGWIRSFSEWAANSWRERCFGPVRVINHGAYAGLGAFAGLLITTSLLGTAGLWSAVLVASAGLLGAGLWAQAIEGSPRLLRPFGYYGGVLGVGAGALVARSTGTNVWPLLGAFAVAGPWIQALGRLRCLVNGCCHGRQSSPIVGIRCLHPRSRVTRLANLAGVPIHPTQTYSLLWNIAVGVVLARLWPLDTDVPLVVGLYLILNGVGRFVEEAYRGEPQTPVWGGLRLYQWMAVGSVLLGAVITACRAPRTALYPNISLAAVLVSMAFGAIVWFAMGVDFPNSNRRFARLT